MATTTTSTAEPAADPWFQDLFAQRIGGAGYGKGNEIDKFELIKRAKRQALAEHPERRMLDFGIGETDEMAPESVRTVMKREVDRPDTRGYADNGIAARRRVLPRASSLTPAFVNSSRRSMRNWWGGLLVASVAPAASISPAGF